MSSLPRLKRSLQGNNSWMVLSPHLDDAVLSCGALLKDAARTRDITVATIFTEPADPPHTRAGRTFVNQCSSPDANTLFEERKLEDREVLEELGVRYLHLGVEDALFRQRRAVPGHRLLKKLLPELVYRYPTYRFDIALGRVSRGDHALIDTLRARVDDLLQQTNADLLFCPLGIGRHVDHVITRLIGTSFPDRVVYYADFPYSLSFPVDEAFIRKHQLQGAGWDHKLATKESMIRGYTTQADALFPDGTIPAVPEMYYAPMS
ncbi:PIG-L family deacetylase [Arthrobacter echini]|uniref:PIG-L family deacetylase n=2 Tax=Arthrobacter echini TaxID=1529066 RepID=A0A5D0XRT5_9MICC|nr:PIG-L family deacetylase [Arthrobacter echini]